MLQDVLRLQVAAPKASVCLLQDCVVQVLCCKTSVCLLQDCIATAEKILQESKAEFSHMESYKSQLQLIWSRDDVQSWLTLFINIIDDSQKALAAMVDASTAKDQVRIGVFVSSQLPSTFSVSTVQPGSHIG